MRLIESNGIIRKTATLLLIVAVVGLLVTATHGRYQPESDPVHFLYTAAKMKVAPPPVCLPPPACVFPNVLSPQPNLWTAFRIKSEKFEFRQVGLSVALQHRSPPFLLS